MSKAQIWKIIFFFHVNKPNNIFPDFSRLRRDPDKNRGKILSSGLETNQEYHHDNERRPIMSEMPSTTPITGRTGLGSNTYLNTSVKKYLFAEIFSRWWKLINRLFALSRESPIV